MSERWSGPFISPNNAGLAMALGVVGAVVVLAILRGRGSWWWGLRGAVGATLPFLAWWLAASGSRAAWLGLAVALGWLMRVGLVPWRWVAGLGLVLVLLITVLPGGRERFSGDILAHPSISHRLALIQGHLAMAWDHPWGVPLADAMPLCEAWYLPAAVHGFYGGSLNDTLVLWGGHGLGAVALVILVAVTVLRWAARPAWRHHPIVAGCVALALLVLVAGQCQAHGHVRAWPQWTGWGIAATLVLALAWVGWRHRPGWVAMARSVAGSVAITGILVPALVGGAWAAARHQAERTVWTTAGWRIEPRAGATRGLVLLAGPQRPHHQRVLTPGWARVATARGHAVGLVQDTDLNSWHATGAMALVAYQDAAAVARGSALPTLLIDPESLPTLRGPARVLRGRWAPFTPGHAEIAEWLESGPGRTVHEVRSHGLLPQRDGAQVASWLARLPSP